MPVCGVNSWEILQTDKVELLPLSFNKMGMNEDEFENDRYMMMMIMMWWWWGGVVVLYIYKVELRLVVINIFVVLVMNDN